MATSQPDTAKPDSAVFHDHGTRAEELHRFGRNHPANTGVRPAGFNAFWLRGTSQTLEVLQELGYTYYIDDVSRDEPFLVNVRNSLSP